MVSLERGERHAALVWLVAVVEQVAGHEPSLPPRRPGWHRRITLSRTLSFPRHPALTSASPAAGTFGPAFPGHPALTARVRRASLGDGGEGDAGGSGWPQSSGAACACETGGRAVADRAFRGQARRARFAVADPGRAGSGLSGRDRGGGRTGCSRPRTSPRWRAGMPSPATARACSPRSIRFCPLDTGTLRALDARVEIAGQDARPVAGSWLRSRGLIPAGGEVR